MTIKLTVLLPIFVPPSLLSVSDRFGLGTVDEYGFRNLGFISIYNVRIGFTSIYQEKSVLFRYHGHDEINRL